MRFSTQQHAKEATDREGFINLQKAIEIATVAEMAILQGTQLTTEQESEEVHRFDYERQCQYCGKRRHSTTTC